jgi:hypothetical protein
MAGQTEGPFEDGEEQADLSERVAALEADAYAAHGYVNTDGEYDERKLLDKLEARILRAEAATRKDRVKVAVTRAATMVEMFPNVPGIGKFEEQPDPEAAAALYAKLDGKLWRALHPNKEGAIQQRLNGRNSLVLCRTQATPEGTWGVYVTRDWNCLLADYTGPAKTEIKKAVEKMGRNIEMVGERLPEYQKKLKRELLTGVKLALDAGVAPIEALITTAAEEEPDDMSDDSAEEQAA